MFIGQSSNWYNPYYISECDKYCNNILFHNGSEVICSVGRGWFDDIRNNEGYSGITLIGVGELKKATNFSDEDKREKSIEKHIKAKEYFYILNPREYGEVTCDLYLYVDEDKIKTVECREYIEDYKSEYDLTYTKYNHRVYKFNINGIIVEVDNRIGKVEIDTKELVESADELEKLFRDNSIFLDKADVCKILNSFEVKVRDKKLLETLP